MGGAAGAGDDDLDAAAGGLLGVAEQAIRASDGPRRPCSSEATPSSSRTATAASSVGKSDRLPPTMPTTGLAFGSVIGRPPSRRPPSRARASARCARSSAVVRIGAERRQVAHLAAFEDVALVVEVEVDGRVGQRDLRAGQPRRASRTRAQQVDHRGRAERVGRAEPAARRSPRMCCSNWRRRGALDRPVAELWTRGASSLTTSEPSRSRNSSAVSVPTGPSRRPASLPIAVARSATSAATGAGRHGFDQDPGVVDVPGDREGRARPVEPRATMIETSASKSSSRSARSGVPGARPEASQAPSNSAAVTSASGRVRRSRRSAP